MNKTIINKNDPKPLYRQIVDLIREKIITKEWEADYQLPAEEDLSKQLGISRGTVRKAISCLIKEGMLIQIHGKGTFVSEQKAIHPFGQELISFAESMERNGIKFDTKVIEKKFITPNDYLKDKFSLTQNQKIFYLKRVRYIDQEPVISIENYINSSLCEGIELIDFESNTLFETIETLSGSKISFGKRRFDAKELMEEEAKWLSLPKGSPILFLDQIIYLNDMIPVESSNVWIKSDKYFVTSYLSRG